MTFDEKIAEAAKEYTYGTDHGADAFIAGANFAREMISNDTNKMSISDDIWKAKPYIAQLRAEIARLKADLKEARQKGHEWFYAYDKTNSELEQLKETNPDGYDWIVVRRTNEVLRDEIESLKAKLKQASQEIHELRIDHDTLFDEAEKFKLLAESYRAKTKDIIADLNLALEDGIHKPLTVEPVLQARNKARALLEGEE